MVVANVQDSLRILEIDFYLKYHSQASHLNQRNMSDQRNYHTLDFCIHDHDSRNYRHSHEKPHWYSLVSDPRWLEQLGTHYLNLIL